MNNSGILLPLMLWYISPKLSCKTVFAEICFTSWQTKDQCGIDIMTRNFIFFFFSFLILKHGYELEAHGWEHICPLHSKYSLRSYFFLKYMTNNESERLHFYHSHVGNHIWAFTWCHDLWPWSKVKRSKCYFCKYLKNNVRQTSFLFIDI